MSQTTSPDSSPPRYWSIATGVITLASLVAGVLIKRLIPGLVLTALAMLLAVLIWRIRTLRYWGTSPLQITRDHWVLSSAASVIVLTVLFFATSSIEPSSTSKTIQASPLVAEVTGCMRTHGLKRAYQELPEQNLSEDPLEEPRPGKPKARRVFAWCDWPRPSWAEADGYTEIAVTELDGPDVGAAGNDLALRIKAPCEKLRMAFTHVHQDTSSLKPFTAEVGSLVTSNGSLWKPRVDQPYPLDTFTPRRDEVVVISGTHWDLDFVKCLA